MKAEIKSVGEDEQGEAGCTGHGRCLAIAPDVYDLDEQGYNEHAGQTIDIEPGHEDSARAGADACPERAIIIIEDD